MWCFVRIRRRGRGRGVQPGAGMVLKDDGFMPLLARSEVAAGTRVMVRPGGLALIAYAGNCTDRVGSGLWLVQEKAPAVKVWR